MSGMKGAGLLAAKIAAERAAGQKTEGAGITATEVAQRLKDAEKTARERLANAYRDAFIAEFGEAKPVVRTAGVVEQEAPPIDLSAIYAACKAIMQAGYEPKDFSIVIPEQDFCQLLGDLSFKVKGDSAGTSTMRVHDLEILRGERDVILYAASLPQMIKSNFEALRVEILRCLGRDAVGKLPKSPSSDSVRAGAEPIGEIPVTPRPASGDDRNPNGLAHLSDEAKVVSAKQAIAAYARNKQLPSAAHLALFGELDGKRAGNKGPGLGQAGWMPDPAPAWHAQIDRLFDIKRNDHSLSAEPLSRAIDQIWVRENGGAYADLIGSRAERLAEMVRRGDSAADGERG